MTDRIHVRGLAVFAHHGLHAEEERLGQRFYIHLEARTDLSTVGRSDRVEDTVSYVELAAIAVDIATTRRFRMIEALAEAIAGEILARLPSVASIVVGVDKPSAPVPAVLESVGVVIERTR